MERTPDDQLNERRVVGGPFNRWLNITGTLIVQGAEDPDFGRYICSTCIARDTPEEQCHNATVTLFLVGGPPTLDEAINNGELKTRTNCDQRRLDTRHIASSLPGTNPLFCQPTSTY